MQPIKSTLSQGPASGSTTLVVVVVAGATSVLTWVIAAWWWQTQSTQSTSSQQQQQQEQCLQQAEQRRKEERTGRIRAEVRLREVSKQLEKLKAEQCVSDDLTKANGATSTADNHSNKHRDQATMLLRSIGHVTSPYTKRMGTPRQPQLVPSSRGFIEFSCPPAAVDGIQAYSHVWILFEFHANTNVDKAKTKIRPPRAGGVKVGQLATRSPHRPNCLGLSLVQIHGWDVKTRRLHIRGLDLVHGTPVYDIKPCVPWDVPNTTLRVPDWVSQTDDTIQVVVWSTGAESDLALCVANGRLAPLYTTHNQGLDAAKQTLQEILAQDPRSSHKGLKQNARGTTTEQGELDADSSYNLVFGQCQVFFVVQPNQVVVERVDEINFEAETTTYADGVPLILNSEKR